MTTFLPSWVIDVNTRGARNGIAGRRLTPAACSASDFPGRIGQPARRDTRLVKIPGRVSARFSAGHLRADFPEEFDPREPDRIL